MKKKWMIFLLLTLLLPGMLFAAGCHGSRGMNAFSMPEGLDADREFDLTFWSKNDTNRTQVKVYEKAIADFEALYPKIHINLRLYTDYSAIYNDVITNIPTHTTPNICITYPDHIATYNTGNNIVVSLDELMADPSYGLAGSELLFDGPTKDEVVPQFLEECRLGEHYYALPYMRSTEACYINRDLVEKLGYTVPDVLTWDFIFEVSEAAMEKDADGNFKINGQKVMIPFIYKSTDNMMIQMIRQKGSGYADENGKIELFNDTTKEMLEEIAVHAGSGAFSTFKISSYPGNFLNAGQCIFAIDSTAGATWIGSEAPLNDISPDKIVSFETVVRMIPQYDPEHPQMISQGPSICLFNKEDPQEVLASWLFMQFLLTNEVQMAYSETEGYVPVTTKAQNDPAYQDYLSREGEDQEHYAVKIQASKLLMEHTGDTFVTPVFNGSASLRTAAGSLIEEVSKSMRRKQTVDDAYYETLYTNMISLNRLNLEGSASSQGQQELGPLPQTAQILLGTLGAVWIGIGLIYLIRMIRARQKRSL